MMQKQFVDDSEIARIYWNNFDFIDTKKLITFFKKKNLF
jgi:hypothetical protein